VVLATELIRWTQAASGAAGRANVGLWPFAPFYLFCIAVAWLYRHAGLVVLDEHVVIVTERVSFWAVVLFVSRLTAASTKAK